MINMDYPLSWNQITKNADVPYGHPKYRNVFNYLIQNQILYVYKTKDKTYFYKLHKNKLRDLIDEQEIINFFIKDYLMEYHPLLATW